MATKTITFTVPGHNGTGSFMFSANLQYDPDRNVTTVSGANVYIGMGSIPGNITYASASVNFTPVDNPSESRNASMIASNLSQTAVSGLLRPTLILPHSFDNPVKQVEIRMHFSIEAVDSSGMFYADGSDDFVVTVDLASIVHVGDLVGSLYVAIDGSWHLGVIHASDGGVFYPSVGYILSAPEKGIEVTYDDAGNVFLTGLSVAHDEQGNVSLIGATVEDDGNGHITIT